MAKIKIKRDRDALQIDIGINTKDRQLIATSLSRLLADTYTLYLQTHGFHWNVQGPMFNTLHTMFMDQYTELWTALDTIAERIRALGHLAPASYRQLTALTSIQEVEGAPPALEMVQVLVTGHESIARTIRELFKLVSSAADESSADLLTQRLQIHEKTAWMLRSLLA
jgi:starvation-inducible DNA-binding protein